MFDDAQEKKAIETALAVTQAKPLLVCHEHLASALELFSRQYHPVSIKESIAAVVSICQIISKTTDTLGDAIKKLPFTLHPALTKAITSLYDAGGIRPGPTAAFDAADAKFFLITAASFVDYLVKKANSHGMTF